MSDANEGTNPADTWSFETKQIHVGQAADATTNARALPIYQTTSYVFNDTQHAANLFGLAEPGNIYTRIMNPTQDAVEQRIAALEGGVAALLVSSGQAAETYSILNIVETSGHVVSSPRLYGGTYNLFHYTLPKLGIEVSFVEDPEDPASWQAAIKDNTRALYGESISNPNNEILDIKGISEVAHRNGLPLIIDNTVATPYLINPLAHGADVVVHSATKYIGGHGTAIGGVIVDGGTFDWRVQRDGEDLFPGFTTPDPSYHGAVFADLGAPAFALKARVQWLRDTGAAIAPFNAFLLAQGLETLSLRIERHVANAQKVAKFLEGHAQVESVAYAGLESSPWYQRGQELAPKGQGAIIAFEINGGVDAGKKFVDALSLHSHVANIGDVRSLVIHPASTTHSQLTPEEQLAAGVTPGLVRLAVGIEGIDDILADLEQGFAAAK
ncbi:bifunctional o-acetylhomoserine/o-acetylserine sulfhydrylase [Gordonia sp. CNJ-863]|jgi:O-acetylhomoserine (thiol)-lyase|uniref:bifunctional o-acetylhomoserine/o-acetylserine sulfhydrylase n=1 Tax=Gordonia TaxID=2053 RepID=UPI0004B9CB85|nr:MULTISPECIES: bifunctional o-acetylhomoserine/o-acetylserine sulfhydrylase [Gordonia]MDH3019069.1 bifunctional o-acetylhomoserine/o-acetylserine sulfhydrylase [Gordonia alkanivorans]MDJ0006126.1 bifunctional o-acetylhomoserine/o-acetylserine sulfhydrylase [Gordonia alkanivorans]MDJ0096179.1 bifunctional o-acetylhomoserine/o-acetylserine sulfhydrylase [Gordonia alkanivorans]MDJ0491753.1 bifunctional o-acetylhomoserine/o-acetylserine sulfhydrylase [Gordonia alkanivorans]OLT49769.1 bifunctiona